MLSQYLEPYFIYFLKEKSKHYLALYGPFDVLFSDDGCYPGSWSCLSSLWASYLLGIPVRVLLVHHCAQPRLPFRFKIEALIDYFVQNWATDIVAISRATRATLMDKRGFNTEKLPIRVIHNGVDILPVDQICTYNIRLLHSIPIDSFLIGILGRLDPYKGHEDLLLALNLLESSLLDKIVVVFIGLGGAHQVSRLHALACNLGISKNLRIVGYIDCDSRMLISQLDLLAMLTKDFEGFGLTVAEAMVVGTPVLSTSVGGIPEFLPSHMAFMVPPESPNDIANAITYIFRNRAEAFTRSTLAKEHIRNFSGLKMSYKFHQLFSFSNL